MSRILFMTEINKTMLLSGGFISFAPLWLSAVLKREGHQCDITGVSYKEAKEVFERFKPDIVAYSAYTGGHSLMVEINKKLKKKFNFFSAFGGPHPTFIPELIEEEESIDGICIGEGFEALPDLVNRLEKGEDISNVLNWWIRAGNKIYKNQSRPLLKNLDDLPFLDRSLYDKYRAYNCTRTASVMTSIGCPFKCTYCYSHLSQKMRQKGDKIVRQRSVDNVIEEIKQLRKNYPRVEYLVFRDDIIILNKEWGREFAEKYSREVGLPFYCLMRPELITEEIGDCLKKAGAYYVGIGIEAGNDYLRNVVLKRAMSKEQIIKGLKILHDRKIKFSLYNIIGVPGETMETAIETWELNVKCDPAFADTFVLTPYPKTDIYKYAVANGYLDPDIKYPLTYHDNLLLKLDDKRRIENFHHLFGISVQFPFLMPVVKILIGLPLTPLYNKIRKLWKGYCFRYRIYPYKVSMLESIRTIYDELFVSKA